MQRSTVNKMLAVGGGTERLVEVFRGVEPDAIKTGGTSDACVSSR
jgi:hypothetical protein